MNAERLIERERAGRGAHTSTAEALGEHGGGLAFRLPRLPITLGLVRHELSRWLEHSGAGPEDVADIVLACSEACANAIEHPRGGELRAFELEAHLHDGVVELTVRDFDRWEGEPPSGDGSRGRGLDMIRALMDQIEISGGEHGTLVAMRRRIAGS
jgi:anti-sigma regulatory factor (Ser/Thr protein kinase)